MANAFDRKASIYFVPSSNTPEEQITVPRRPTPKSLESLHITLQKLEQASDIGNEDTSISELKQVVLNRIIDLELSNTLAIAEDEIEEAPGPSDLVPPMSIAEERALDKGIGNTSIEKLD